MNICFLQTQSLAKAITCSYHHSPISELASSREGNIIYSTAHLRLPIRDINRLTFSCQLASKENIVRGGAGPKEVILLYLQTKADVTFKTNLRTQHLSEAIMISLHARILITPPKT